METDEGVADIETLCDRYSYVEWISTAIRAESPGVEAVCREMAMLRLGRDASEGRW